MINPAEYLTAQERKELFEYHQTGDTTNYQWKGYKL